MRRHDDELVTRAAQLTRQQTLWDGQLALTWHQQRLDKPG